MAAPKFLRLVAGRITEILGLQSSAGAGDADKIVSTDANGRLDPTLMPGGSPVNASAGAGDSGKLPKLDASGKLSTTMMPTGVAADTLSVVTSENLSAGNYVNLWNDAGTLKARKADATAAGKEVDGFVLAAVTAPAAVDVYFDGSITGLSGLTLGAEYFLSTTPGAGVATTPPSTAGNVVQSVGKATSATTLVFEKGVPVTLA